MPWHVSRCHYMWCCLCRRRNTRQTVVDGSEVLNNTCGGIGAIVYGVCFYLFWFLIILMKWFCLEFGGLNIFVCITSPQETKKGGVQPCAGGVRNCQYITCKSDITDNIQPQTCNTSQILRNLCIWTNEMICCWNNVCSYFFFFWQKVLASRWRVCHQRGLTRVGW